MAERIPNWKKMSITIVSLGRFHVADLARELTVLGHNITFISDVPGSRLNQFGLQKCRKITVWPATVLTLVGRVLSRLVPGRSFDFSLLKHFFIEVSACLFSSKCDVIIGMSGIVLHAGRFLRWRDGAEFWLERGSQHILAQEQILRAFSGPDFALPRQTVSRELRGYQYADRVSIPSQHVKTSFLAHDYPEEKLFLNPLGVDLTRFPWVPAPDNLRPTVIMVGIWCKRKGCDLIARACEQLPEVYFLHIGPVGDVSCPIHLPNFLHIDSVDQSQLSNWYASAHLMLLPSREDGFGIVQAQALASGLFLIASDRTGGEDLKELLDDTGRIQIIPHDNLPALVSAIQTLLPLAVTERGEKAPWSDRVEVLSWVRYAAKYQEALLQAVG